jgi:alpha-glucosidase/alpha-D-xyloside xylohydrolase
LYLPVGTWHDYWTGERVTGGREIERPVDLATTPLYVRAGAIIPMGPVKQYTSEPSDEPLTMVVYPGADGESHWYEDDGKSFDYANGESMSAVMTWHDKTRRLSIRLASGSKFFGVARHLRIRLAGSPNSTEAIFSGKELSLTV